MEFLYLFLRHQFYGESSGGMAKCRLVSKVSKSSAIFSSTAPRAVRPFSVVKFTIYDLRQSPIKSKPFPRMWPTLVCDKEFIAQGYKLIKIGKKLE